MTLPYLNLKTIQKATDLPGYVHRAAYLISEQGMYSCYSLFEGLSPMEFQHLLLISKTLLSLTEGTNQITMQDTAAISHMVNTYQTFASVLSCGEGSVFVNDELIVQRVFNLTRMVGYWLLQGQGLGTIIKDKFSVNVDKNEKMFISMGEEPPTQKEIVVPPQPQLH